MATPSSRWRSIISEAGPPSTYSLAFAAGSSFFDLPKGAVFATDPARFVRDIVLMRRTFYLVDVMLLYAFPMALTPVAIWLLKRGWWPPLVVVFHHQCPLVHRR